MTVRQVYFVKLVTSVYILYSLVKKFVQFMVLLILAFCGVMVCFSVELDGSLGDVEGLKESGSKKRYVLIWLCSECLCFIWTRLLVCFTEIIVF